MKIAALLDRLVGRVERAEALDAPSDALAAASNKVLGGRLATDLASGTPIGHPVHPLLVAIPIGSWMSAMIFDLTGDRDGAQRLVGIGIASATPAVVSGLSDWAHTAGGERRVGLAHAVLNTAALAAYGVSWVARRQGRHKTGIAWSVVGASALSSAGWLGGHLAYALGVGVDTTAFQHTEQSWSRVAAASEVPAGQLSSADLDGVPLLLTRGPAGDVIVMADRCTHRGAPLHEGRLEDGCIVCPWHHSEFAVDGSVLRGPATRPQQVYEVDVRGDDIFVRRSDEPRTLRTNPVGV